jgi:citrate synthase
MRIGSSGPATTKISGSSSDTMVVRGYDLVNELVGKISFTDHIWLLIAGRLPSDAQRRMLDAALVALAEHGMVPSVQASRMTLAAAPEAMQGAVAAGLLGCGSVILGAAETAGKLFEEILDVTRSQSVSTQEAVHVVVKRYRADRKAIPGYGHPYYKERDPRAQHLLAIARQEGISARYTDVALAVDVAIPEIVGKRLVLNISSAIACGLLDAGYPLLALKGVPILARTASLVAHLLEEQTSPIGFLLSDAAASAVAYDGPAPAGFVAHEN